MSIFSPASTYFHCDELIRDDFYGATWSHRERTKKVLLAIFNGAMYKGFETLVEVVFLVKRMGRNIELHVAGVTEKDHVVRLVKKRYPKDEFQENIKLLGQIAPPVLAGELANADVFVHPSHIDNSPNSVCEAMLIGTPVVSTNVGGVPSLLQDKHEGLLVQDGDPYAMAAAVLEIIENPVLARQISAAAQALARYRHDSDRVTTTLHDIYSDVLKAG